MRSCPDTDVDPCWVSFEFAMKATKNSRQKNNLLVIGIAFPFRFKFQGFLGYNIFHVVIFKGNVANLFHQRASLNSENKGDSLKSELFYLYMCNKKSSL